MLTKVVLEAPEVSAQRVTFRWHVEPPSRLYRQTSFSFDFPAGIDLSAIPERLLWTVMFLCLHSHWVLMRPCRVELPVEIDADEIEFWLRLMDSEVATLEALRGTGFTERSITIAPGEIPLAPYERLAEQGRCATAFSGGKDSLLQTGLLHEFVDDLTLVATTSPMEPLNDHVTPRRQFIFSEIERRLGVPLVEVRSDLRSIWEIAYASLIGYPLAISELTDAFIYFSATLLCGVARGATHYFLASEADVQQSAVRDGRIVQISHFMYTVATQRAIESLLRPLGIGYGSLTSPLRNAQVQHVLWRRYPEISDLQYSCWRVPTDAAACNECTQCLRIGINALYAGGDPARMGIDLARVLRETRDWKPKSAPVDDNNALPNDVVAGDLSAQLVHNIRALSTDFVRDVGGAEALLGFEDLRARVEGYPASRTFGYRRGYVAGIDTLMREHVDAVFAEYFAEEPPELYSDVLDRTAQLADRIAEPLKVRQ